VGVQTIDMQDGRFDWTWQARTGENSCSGAYEISGDRVVFKEDQPCGGAWEARFELVDDRTLEWRAAKSHSVDDQEDQLLRELLHSKPWKRIR
jgi:hypothetical protein